MFLGFCEIEDQLTVTKLLLLSMHVTYDRANSALTTSILHRLGSSDSLLKAYFSILDYPFKIIPKIFNKYFFFEVWLLETVQGKKPHKSHQLND